MAKQKALTQAEIFKAQEELERDLCLPPGLNNHGNTCFMNSTLQGLIATRYLKDLVQNIPLPPAAQQSASLSISSHRSPLLTDLAARRDEKDEKNGTGGSARSGVISPIFLSVMSKAWLLQQERRRLSMSPKDLLTALGRKYDQYLDFRQQDAHEFLRQLLDAMRMEEIDIIKVRQPKPKRQLRRRPTMRSGVFMPQTPSPLAAVMNHSLTMPPPADDDEKLVPFVDMLFGGRLTSILVCQECKHISRTYEDFNDLSLSIKPEDYSKERKRDRLKNFAKKFKLQTSGNDAIRASSVPASPRKSAGDSHPDESLLQEPRRRSADIPNDIASEALSTKADHELNGGAEPSIGMEDNRPSSSEQARLESKDELLSTANSETEPIDERDRVEFVEPLKPERVLKDDGWAKFGRRMSLAVRAKDKASPRRSLSRGRQPDVSKGRTSLESNTSSNTPVIKLPPRRPSDPLISPPLPSPLPSPGIGAPLTQSVSLSPALLAKTNSNTSIPLMSPPLPALKFPNLSRTSSPSGKPHTITAPKPSPEEQAYLRQVLADVNPSSNPLGIFKPPGLAGTSATQLLMKMGQLPGIEECLRMFTAVENLDGENMVGCRRCWKIANGVYKPRKHLEDSDDTDESDAETNDVKTPVQNSNNITPTAARGEIVVEAPSPQSSTSASPPPSASSSIISLDVQSKSDPYDTPQSSLSNETSSARDISDTNKPFESEPPIGGTSRAKTLVEGVEPMADVTSVATVALPSPIIPTISTTAPEPSPAADSKSSQTPIVIFKDIDGLDEVLAAPLPKRDSLLAPRMLSHKRIPGYTDSADESSDNEGESDVSRETSIYSETSSLASQSANPSLEDLVPPVKAARPPVSLKVPSKPSRPPRQVIMRPAYKRYLIATPPPILVIHLKRFQQISKSPMISFSSGFKKLDDYVAFPEMLNLTPFLAPKREDFGLGRGGKIKFIKPKKATDCMYRLYAVVVHIGNMLGGHYVAYTALPTGPPEGVPNATPEITSRSDSSTVNLESATPRKWAYISDTVVRLATIDEVYKAKAYICMYERV